MKIFDLRCEYMKNPIGIAELTPRFFWKLSSTERDKYQSAYRIQVAFNEQDLLSERDLVWDSGRFASAQSIQVEYAGLRLKSRQRYYWRVKVWDELGQESEWSEAAFWEMGLIHAEDWSARMIEPEAGQESRKPCPCPIVRREFSIEKDVSSARLYITSRGLYEAWINGARVGDAYFTPGWTDYNRHFEYQTYDVTNLLKSGNNAIGVILADGWYRGYITFAHVRNVYGDRLALLAQLEINFTDGTGKRVITDKQWHSFTGPVLESDILDGETYDARLEIPGWSEPGFKLESIKGVVEVPFDASALTAHAGVPVKKVEEIRPKKTIKTPSGQTVVDFGQNIVGWVRLRAKGKAGTRITLKHGEVLDRKGEFYNKNYRLARATNTFILKGSGDYEYFEPRFTYTGFRYVKVDGYPGELTLDDLIGCVVHSDLERTASFECSNEKLNRLFENVIWTQRDNFFEIPTDCPQRDERLGWTGDILFFGRAACQLMNSAAFLSRWLSDVRLAQEPCGRVPVVVPNPFSRGRKFIKCALKQKRGILGVFRAIACVITQELFNGSIAWGDAAIFIPWYLYVFYGDKRSLERNYETMRLLFSYREKQAEKPGSFIYLKPAKWFKPDKWKYLRNYYTASLHYGDWLAPGDGVNLSILKAKFQIPTCIYAMDALLLEKISRCLKKEKEAKYYREKYEEIKESYINLVPGKDGRLFPDNQSSYTLALASGLLRGEKARLAAKRLVELIRRNGDRIGTGMLGTSFIMRVLDDHDATDVAYDILLQSRCPSWLYQVEKGATTMWEHWDAIKENGSFQSDRMLSFNHYALGSVADWLIGSVAGINPDENCPGFSKIILKPRIDRRLTFAGARLKTIHGEMECFWELKDDDLFIRISIPPNTSAEVHIPEGFEKSLAESGRTKLYEGHPLNVGSGIYNFRCSQMIHRRSGEKN